jgi:hypothetical protein
VKIVVRLALIACAYTAAHAFAAEPSATEPPAATETPATSPQASSTTSTSAPAAKQPTKVVLIDNTPNDEQLKQILAKGYRPEGKGDKVLYCRKEAQVGTRFETKTCRTSARILEDEVNAKAATERAQRVGGSQKAN